MCDYKDPTYFEHEHVEDIDPLWQTADVDQKVLDSARGLWERSVQQNLRDAVSSANASQNSTYLALTDIGVD